VPPPPFSAGTCIKVHARYYLSRPTQPYVDTTYVKGQGNTIRGRSWSFSRRGIGRTSGIRKNGMGSRDCSCEAFGLSI
jgi:predicted porin